MIKWIQYDTIKGVNVFSDDTNPAMFYLLPTTPRFRLNPTTGLPVMTFLKYRSPIQRDDGKKGGGFLIFDTELAVDEAVLEEVRGELQGRLAQRFRGNPPQVRIGSLTYTKGAVALNLLDKGGRLVEKVNAASSPALYGTLVAPFTAELSPEGATLLEQALQGQGGVVQVMYDVYTYAKLPPVVVTIWFEAEKFMSFKQEVNIDWDACGDDTYKEKIREEFRASQTGDVIIDFGTVTEEKIRQPLRDWAWRTLEEAMQRLVLGDIPPVSEDARKVPDGIEKAYRDFEVKKTASFRQTYKENQVMEWNPAPRGTLPNITSLKGKDGKPLKWEDFARTVDLDDPFFRRLAVRVLVGADFKALPIDSVEVKLRYKAAGKTSIGEFVATEKGVEPGPSDAIIKMNGADVFAAFVDADKREYEYEYEVSYKGAAKTLKSGVLKADDSILKINVDDTGILAIDFVVGDIDFDQVKSAQVHVEYEDAANKVAKIAESFVLTKDAPTTQLRKIIFAPRDKPYRYKVTYTMANGRQFASDWKESNERTLHVNDPFAATKTIIIRPVGDFEKRVNFISVDLVYEDRAVEYKLTNSINLDKDTPNATWDIPVMDETRGKLTYRGTVMLKDGTSFQIPEAEAKGGTLVVGMPTLKVSVLPDLLDWDKLKLVKVTLRYADPANGIDETEDLVFRKGDAEAKNWECELADRTRKTYTVSATYFLTDNTQKKSGPVETTEETFLPEMPA